MAPETERPVTHRLRLSRRRRQSAEARFSLQQWIFELLKLLGIEQKTLAAFLGVSKTLVSFWANEREPLPQQYRATLIKFVCDAAAEALRQAEGVYIPHGPEEDQDDAEADFLDKELQRLGAQILGKHVTTGLKRHYLEAIKLRNQLLDMRGKLFQACDELYNEIKKQCLWIGEHHDMKQFIVKIAGEEKPRIIGATDEQKALLRKSCLQIVFDLEKVDAMQESLETFNKAFVRMRQGQMIPNNDASEAFRTRE